MTSSRLQTCDQAGAAALIDVPGLVTAYFADRPDPSVAAQRVVFGTSGHRGSALDASFNEWHVLAITQALCDFRRVYRIDGPLFLGADTHALSAPASATAIEVLAANGVELMLAVADEFTPTPAVSHAILSHNRNRRPDGRRGQADGLVITPSHNPPRDGGIKYNPPHGGPAGQAVTDWIGAAANRYLETGLSGVRRVLRATALNAFTTHRHDYLHAYVADLGSVIDMDAIRRAGLNIGVDPLGGAGVHYWAAIAERYRIRLNVVSELVDPAFGFMSPDGDGKIRMDPSSVFAMKRLIARRHDFDLAFACDTDHDRHGIVTPALGLLPANHYLSAAVDYLYRHRPGWGRRAAVGKTVVTTQLIDRVAERLGRTVFEVPAGFKWFSAGLLDGNLGFAGEESAGASFLRHDGRPWTTDKDGMAAGLLAAEMTAVTGRDPGSAYEALVGQLGCPVARQVQGVASRMQRARLAKLLPGDLRVKKAAGEDVVAIQSRAPGNDAPIGGIRVCTRHGWFAVRPSGTEDLYKIYAESFDGPGHLGQLVQQAQTLADGAMGPPGP